MRNPYHAFVLAEAVAQRCSVRKMFEKFCKIHWETPASESLL